MGAKERAKELESLYKDKKIQVIFCARGGFGCQEILEYLDFDIIKRNPKILIGYSDISVLLNSIYEKAGIGTYIGPMLIDLLKIEKKSFFDNFRKYIISNFRKIPNVVDVKKIEILQKGFAEGKIIGGNLSALYAMNSTPYEINFNNKILFLEEVDEDFYHIDRMITNLLQSRKIFETKGIVFGDFTNVNNKKHKFNLSLKELIMKKLKDYKGPILWNYPLGHENTRNFLPIGARCTLDLANGNKVLKFYT